MKDKLAFGMAVPAGALAAALVLVSCARPAVRGAHGSADAMQGPAVADTIPASRPAGAAADTLRIMPLPMPARMWTPPEGGEQGLRFRVRAVSAEPASGGAAGAVAEPLSADATARLLDRLPALPSADERPFRFPAQSPPAPRAGAVVAAALAPDTAPARPTVPDTAFAGAALRVLRVVPDGDAALVPHVTVTFSEPMIPLTGVAAADAAAPPVRLSPQPPGRWTWIDPRTARFVAEPRLPQATSYRVEVPAGTRSAGGTTLAEPIVATFRTPGPVATGGYPALHPDAPDPADAEAARRGWSPWMHAGHATAAAAHLDQLMLVAFDQDVDAAAVLRTTRLRVDGRTHPLRLASAAELAADSTAQRMADAVAASRRVAFAPARPLPHAADVRLVVEAGTASAEGPLGSAAAQVMRFRTHGPFTVQDSQCGRERECRPSDPWVIRFSNPIDAAAWSDDLVRIEPALDGATIDVSGSMLFIMGTARPDTRYTVTLDPAIRDVFGQRLGGSRSLAFSVGRSEPEAALDGGPIIVLDPAGPPVVRVRSRGATSLDITIHRVSPGDYAAWTDALDGWRGRPGELKPPGAPVVSRTIEVPGGAGYAETLVDVSPALVDGLGHAIVLVVPGGTRRDYRTAWAWVQATRIGLTAAVDPEEITVWETSLRDGRPLGDVAVRLLPSGQGGATNDDGVAAIPLVRQADHVLVASLGADSALLPEAGSRRGAGWRRAAGLPDLLWYTVTDRGLYRPGESAHLKGWIRRQPATRSPAPELPDDVRSVGFQVRGPRGEELASGDAALSRLGGFHTVVELPESLNLGQASVLLEAVGPGEWQSRRSQRTLQVQEFRRPDHEVIVEADPGPYVVGDVVHATLRAQYYGGGGLADASVRWRFHSHTTWFTPPGRDEWHFGRAPWMTFGDASSRPAEVAGQTDRDGTHRVRVDLLSADPPFTSQLRAEGQAQDLTRQVGAGGVTLLVHPADVHVGIRLSRGWARVGQAVEVGIVVVDHDGTMVAGRPVEVVTERVAWTWRGGSPEEESSARQPVCRIVSAVEEQTCRLVAGEPGFYRIRADVRDDADRISRTEHTLWVAGASGVWQPGEDEAAVRLVADRTEYQPGDTARVLVQAPFRPAQGLLTVRSVGVVRTEPFRPVSDSHELRIPIDESHVAGIGLRVELVDSAGLRGASGETRLSVPPHGRRLDVRVAPQSAVAQPGSETWIDVEIRDAAGAPVAGAEVALWMVDEAILALGGYDVPDPVRLFHGEPHARVQDYATRGWVVAWPRSAGPGTVSGAIVSDGGAAVAGAQVAIEGVEGEAFTTFDGAFVLRGVSEGPHTLVVLLPDGRVLRREIRVPAEGIHLGTLITTPHGGLGQGAGLPSEGLELAQLAVAAAPVAAPAPPPEAGLSRAEKSVVEVRADFAALAFFEPAVTTGPDGTARVRARLPGSLTRYRVIAVAAAGADRFGTGQATVTARRELMARLTPPRFLNFGDTFELPVLVQNMTESEVDADVAVRASGIDIRGAAGRRITLPAGGRAELRFDAAVATVGAAHVQAIASVVAANDRADAVQVSVPVYTPATAEAFALHGETDGDSPLVLPVSVPSGVIEEFGGLDVTVTSTALHALTDAVLYLKAYPFDYAEPIASRLVATVALRDVLQAFDASGAGSREEVDASVRHDIDRLVALQSPDGGWGFWRRDERSHPFVSVHVVHALQRAREKGYDVPGAALSRATSYLLRVADVTAEWPQAPRRSVQAYAVYVRHRLGDPAAATDARRLATAPADRVGGELPLEAVGWLLSVLASDAVSGEVAAELLRRIVNRLDVTAGTATFAERYTDGEHLLLHSRRRTDAIVLEALIAADASNDLIPRIAQSLLAQRVAGAWRGTQENAWVLLALDRYFRTYEAVTPDFTARVWLGDRFAGGHAFRGRTTERAQVDVPMAQLTRTSAADVVIARQGSGRMYYRAGLRYAPEDLRTDALQRGFAVNRRYEWIDDAGDVRRDADGTWRVRAGARVRVTVTMVAPSVRYHVALVDPLPAGFEVLNPELRGTALHDAPEPGPAARPLLPRPRWYGHENLRDDRAEAFATLLPAGVHEYSYVARATTPGSFVAPPPRAEMMYEPETFGTGAGERVIVEGADPRQAP